MRKKRTMGREPKKKKEKGGVAEEKRQIRED
jgi:hypothetical protein